MRMEAPDINDAVIDFSRRINPHGNLEFIPFVNVDGARIAGCNENVANLVRVYGGFGVSGWAIWWEPDRYLMAEAHVIWRTPQGELVDITPREGAGEAILFLEHEYEWPEMGFMPESRYRLLEDTAVIRALIAFHRAYYRFRIENRRNPTEQERQCLLLRIVPQVRDHAFVDGLCPCGSGLDFVKCCGRPAGSPDPYTYAPV